jgi:NitT/TauT family transport system ATP-binding protein
VFLGNRVIVLSKGKVLEQITVDLPRPRAWDALNEDDRFKALTGRVLQLVRSA